MKCTMARHNGWRLSACLVLLTSLSGCGYSATRLLPSNYRNVYVEPFQNKIRITEEVSERLGFQTNVPGLEEKVTRGVIDRFLFDGNLRVTTKPEEADLILTGALTDFYRQPLRRTDDSTVEEYRLNLVAALSLRDRHDNLVWEEPGFIGDATYVASGSSATSESDAVVALTNDFARRVVERVIENW